MLFLHLLTFRITSRTASRVRSSHTRMSSALPSFRSGMSSVYTCTASGFPSGVKFGQAHSSSRDISSSMITTTHGRVTTTTTQILSASTQLSASLQKGVTATAFSPRTSWEELSLCLKVRVRIFLDMGVK